MIKLKGVSKLFGDFHALDEVSAEIQDSSIYGLIGYNGAGKTTLLNIISGLYKSSSGEVRIELDGELLDPFDNVRVKHNLFYVSDDPYFIPNASLYSMRDFYCGFYRSFSNESFEKLVKLFKLDPYKRIADFSKGMKRQAAIILGMSTRVKYLLLDESFDGLDPAVRVLVSNLLTEYLLEVGATIIVASHNLYELENIYDTIGMINGKRLIFSRDIDEIRSGVFKYRAVMSTPIAEASLAELSLKSFSRDGNIHTFVCERSEDEVKAALSSLGELLLLESCPLSLSEIFNAEIGEGDERIEGIFE